MSRHNNRTRRSSASSDKYCTCIEPECPLQGEKFYTNASHCPSCKGPIFFYDDIQFVEADDNGVYPDVDTAEDIDSARVRSQMLFDNAQRNATGSQNYAKLSMPSPSETFSCPETLTGCPVATKPIVNIPAKLYEEWVWLAREFSTEWIAYLHGSEISPGTYDITGYYFPKQKVTPAHCEAEDGEIQEGVIGTVHSHVGMSAFFSEEDKRHFNHPVELVLNNRGDMKANCLGKLECGRLHRNEGNVFLVGEGLFSATAADLRSKLIETKPAFPVTTWTTPTGYTPPGFVNGGGKDTRSPAERMKDSEQLALQVMPNVS